MIYYNDVEHLDCVAGRIPGRPPRFPMPGMHILSFIYSIKN